MKETLWNRSEKVDHLAYKYWCVLHARLWNHQNNKKFGPVLVNLQALCTQKDVYGTTGTQTCGIKIHPNFYDVACYILNIKAFEEPSFQGTFFYLIFFHTCIIQ